MLLYLTLGNYCTLYLVLGKDLGTFYILCLFNTFGIIVGIIIVVAINANIYSLYSNFIYCETFNNYDY